MFHKLIILFSFLLAVSSHAKAEESFLFVGTHFPLILQKAQDGKLQGVAVELLKRISEHTGDRFEIRIMPWSRALNLVKNGHAAGLIGPYKSKEREQFLNFTPIHFYEDRMVFLKTNTLDVNWSGDFTEIGNLRVLTIKNWVYGADFDTNRQRLNIQETIQPANAIKMLFKSRTDLLAFNERNAIAELKKQNLTHKASILKPHFNSAKGYFGLSKKYGNDAFQKRFNQALTALYQNGEIQSFNAQFGLGYQGY